MTIPSKPPGNLCRSVEADVASQPDPQETAFLAWLFGLGGLDLSKYRSRPLHRRLKAALRMLRVSSLDEARLLVEQNRNLVQVALDAVIIGTTALYRDPPVFDHLAVHVLPDLLRRQANPRIWSAACSTGAELYTVAMLLAQRTPLHCCCLSGTDYRPRAIRQASEGWFCAEVAETLPADLRATWLMGDRGGYRVSPFIRQHVEWRVADVFACEDCAAWDLILCRNLAIYLEAGASGELWRRLGRSLRPGGVLVVGKAEKPAESLGLVKIGPCIYRREEHT